jgi:hypothetical protein
MMENVGRGMEFVLQFVQVVDIERNYFSKAKILSLISAARSVRRVRRRAACPASLFELRRMGRLILHRLKASHHGLPCPATFQKGAE